MERDALFSALRDKGGGKGSKTTFVREIAALSGFFAFDFDGDPRLPLGAGTAADRIQLACLEVLLVDNPCVLLNDLEAIFHGNSVKVLFNSP